MSETTNPAASRDDPDARKGRLGRVGGPGRRPSPAGSHLGKLSTTGKTGN